MTIDLTYVAQLKAATGTGRETLDVPAGTTVRGLIDLLVQRHGDDLASLLLDDGGNVRPSILVFRGETQSDGADTTPLTDGEALTLLTPLAGG